MSEAEIESNSFFVHEDESFKDLTKGLVDYYNLNYPDSRKISWDFFPLTEKTDLKALIDRMNKYEVLILHYSTREIKKLIEIIHQEAPYIRIIVISGNFPYGKEEVQEMGADAYARTDSFDFICQQIARGFVSRDEIKERGNKLSLPPPAPRSHFF